MSAAAQASRYLNTRRRLARQQCQQLTQITDGMSVNQGDVFGAYNGTQAYGASNTGTVTGTPPTNVEPPLSMTLGAVTFIKVNVMTLLRLAYGD
jgi:hypothetical protein